MTFHSFAVNITFERYYNTAFAVRKIRTAPPRRTLTGFIGSYILDLTDVLKYLLKKRTKNKG